VGTEPFREIPPEVIRMIPEHLAQKHQMVPLAVEGKRLRLAMMNPGDILVMDEVAFLTGMQVEPQVSSENHLLDALERYYQIPRSIRETIPLAGHVGGVKLPHGSPSNDGGTDYIEPPPVATPWATRPTRSGWIAAFGLIDYDFQVLCGKRPPATAVAPRSAPTLPGRMARAVRIDRGHRGRRRRNTAAGANGSNPQ
jgi:hypothetical protein